MSPHFALLNLALSLLFIGAYSQTRKEYYIRNADGTHLLSRKDGVTCGPLSSVVASAFVDNRPEFRWIFDSASMLNAGEERNELSFTAGGCFHVYRWWENAPAGNGYYLLRRQEDKLCLTTSGNGKRVVWEVCNIQNRNQQWQFPPAN